jgi:hypothetical protein
MLHHHVGVRLSDRENGRTDGSDIVWERHSLEYSAAGPWRHEKPAECLLSQHFKRLLENVGAS